MKIVRSGDTIIFDSVSRMSRNAETGFEVYQELYDKEIELVSFLSISLKIILAMCSMMILTTTTN